MRLKSEKKETFSTEVKKPSKKKFKKIKNTPESPEEEGAGAEEMDIPGMDKPTLKTPYRCRRTES